MIAVHFRYPWIAPAALSALAPRSPELTQLSALLARRPGCAEPSAAAAVAGARRRLAAFARAPLGLEAPSAAFCERARAHAHVTGERELLELANWAGQVAGVLRACGLQGQTSSVDDLDEITFLEALAETDFPTLLLWTAPDVARRHFVSDGIRPRFAPHVIEGGKARRRALRLCLSHALGSIGRTAPRGGWVGAGFGVLDDRANAPTITRELERLAPEPNLSWYERRGVLEGPPVVIAGESAWDHLLRRLTSASWRSRIARARGLVTDLGNDAWSYDAVDRFLRQTARLFDLTDDDAIAPWWLTRMLRSEVKLPASLYGAARAAHAEVRADGQRAGGRVPAPGPSVGGASLLPYPVRLARERQDALVCDAEELFDWVMDPAVAREATPAAIGDLEGPYALVARFDSGAAAPLFVEPNPRRTADRFAALMESAPAFSLCDRDAVALQPPVGIVDNRLLRPSAEERDLDDVDDGVDAVLRTSLSDPLLASRLARELASPRYAVAPDIRPRWFCATSARLSFGRVDPEARIWLLTPEEAAAAADFAGSAAGLAALYALEAAPALGAPAFIDVIIDGKRSRSPTHATVFFGRMLHACRNAKNHIVVGGVERMSRRCAPALLDAKGRQLSCDVYLCAVKHP